MHKSKGCTGSLQTFGHGILMLPNARHLQCNAQVKGYTGLEHLDDGREGRAADHHSTGRNMVIEPMQTLRVCMQVKGYTGLEHLEDAVKGAQLIIIPAGVPRKPGMTRDDLFNINASIVKTLVEACAKAAPDVCHRLTTWLAVEPRVRSPCACS